MKKIIFLFFIFSWTHHNYSMHEYSMQYKEEEQTFIKDDKFFNNIRKISGLGPYQKLSIYTTPNQENLPSALEDDPMIDKLQELPREERLESFEPEKKLTTNSNTYEEDGNWGCLLCNKKFNASKELFDHTRRKKHIIEFQKLSDDQRQKIVSKSFHVSYVCKEHLIYFNNQKGYSMHMHKSHKYTKHVEKWNSPPTFSHDENKREE